MGILSALRGLAGITGHADGRLLDPLSRVAPPGPDKEGPSPRHSRWQDQFFPLLGTDDAVPCDFAAAGVVWLCHYDRVISADGQRLRGYGLHPVARSSDVPCPGSAVYLVTTLLDEDTALFVCAAHEAWLYEHIFIDNMRSGRCASRIEGVWETHLPWVWNLPEARGRAHSR